MFELIITYAIIPVLSISIFLVFLRLLIGPAVEDRIVAFDILAAIAIAFLSIYSLKTHSITILDVGIILALLAFLGTVALAYYLERRTRK